MQDYVDRLSSQLDGQTLVADHVFASPMKAMLAFVKEVVDTVLTDYTTKLIDCAKHGGDIEVYLKAVVGTYHQWRRLVMYLTNPRDATDQFPLMLSNYVDKLFEPQIEPYLRAELDHYKKGCDTVVDSWKQKVSNLIIKKTKYENMNEKNSPETAIQGSAIRENDKTNFLASFKKVILLPVSVLPTLPFPGTRTSQFVKSSNLSQTVTPARPSTPSDWIDLSPGADGLPMAAPPMTELAAQTAILNSRLERIKTLFSIEVALKLIHMGKEVLERMKSFRHIPGEIGEKVYRSCCVLG